MRFLILTADYPEFLDWLYAENPGLAGQPYSCQARARVESLFPEADFCIRRLRNLGHESFQVFANNRSMQEAWAREHGVPAISAADEPRWETTLRGIRRRAAGSRLQRLKPLFRPILKRLNRPPAWYYEILAAQVRHYRPDVLLNQDPVSIEPAFLRSIRQDVRLLVGQIAAPFPQDLDFSVYDLVLSSLPNFVDRFRAAGVRSELYRLAFEPSVLDAIGAHPRTIPVSFVGGITSHHGERFRLIERLAAECDIQLWLRGSQDLPPGSATRRRCHGPAWGRPMFEILRRSRITINTHIDVAGRFANNMRLYEATGCGALLVTDWKENLQDLFDVGKELVAYRTPEECVELVRYYSEHDAEREAIAQAGQRRTLRDHTYEQRMRELAGFAADLL